MDDQPPPYPVTAEVVRETTPVGTITNIAVNQVIRVFAFLLMARF